MNALLSDEVLSQQGDLEIRVSSLVVTSDEQRAEAEDTIRDIKALRKSIEDFFDPMVKSAHAAHKAATKARGDAIKPLDEMEASIRAKIIPYAQAKARAEAEAQALIKKEMEDAAYTAEVFGDDVAAHVLKQQADAIKPGKATGTRDNWKWRVVGVVDPRYTKPDEDLLNALAKSKKGEAQVEGIEFYNEPILVVK